MMTLHFSLHSSYFYRTKVNFGGSSSRYFIELQKAGSNLGLSVYVTPYFLFDILIDKKYYNV